MKNLIKLNEYTLCDLENIFKIADEVNQGKYRDFLKDKTIATFFPNTSIRTRVSFERGIYLLGGQSILFPPEALDKKEKLEDVLGYLNNWVAALIIRHKNIEVLEELAQYKLCPIINAMTDINHPCEMLSDIYTLRKLRPNLNNERFLFVGPRGNIGLAWQEITDLLGVKFTQCCPEGYDIPGVKVIRNLKTAIQGQDIVCTDSLSATTLSDFGDYQISLDLMKQAAPGAILNPCPPFFRGEEVTEDVIASSYFVGYEFKKNLLAVQQAIIIYCLKA